LDTLQNKSPNLLIAINGDKRWATQAQPQRYLRGVEEKDLSWFQRVLRRFASPATFEKMKADSQRWFLCCPCGKETSFWEIGGVRYKARGNPRKLMRCSQCGEARWHKVIYRADAADR
jgi:hypothetical protein